MWNESSLHCLAQSLTQEQESQDGIYCFTLTAVSAQPESVVHTFPRGDADTGRAVPAKCPEAAVKIETEHWAVLPQEELLLSSVPLLLWGQTFQWCFRHVWSCFIPTQWSLNALLGYSPLMIPSLKGSVRLLSLLPDGAWLCSGLGCKLCYFRWVSGIFLDWQRKTFKNNNDFFFPQSFLQGCRLRYLFLISCLLHQMQQSIVTSQPFKLDHLI